MSARVDGKLEVGAAAQAVEVSAERAFDRHRDAKTSVTMNNKLVDELPLVVGGAMRSPFNLAALTPEAKNLGGDNGFILGGGQAAGYGTTLDGVTANTTRALSPELGRRERAFDRGGHRVHSRHQRLQSRIRAGQRRHHELRLEIRHQRSHGSAYDFVRNEKFDANNFFNNGRGIPRAIYKQHDFGASAGGPVWIPKIYNGKNRTFFFWSYEAFRNRDGANGNVRDRAHGRDVRRRFSQLGERRGRDVSRSTIRPRRPRRHDGTVTRSVFPGNIIPKSLFDPTVVKALAAFRSGPTPLPNNGAAPGTFELRRSTTTWSPTAPRSGRTPRSASRATTASVAKSRISGYWGYNRSSQKPGANGAAGTAGLLRQLQRPAAQLRRLPRHLGLRHLADHVQPLLRRRQ